MPALPSRFFWSNSTIFQADAGGCRRLKRLQKASSPVLHFCDFVPTFACMHEAKNTARALVRIGFDGRVHKYFRGPQAKERYDNEVRVLRFLEAKKCNFVPKIILAENEELYLVTTNAGKIALRALRVTLALLRLRLVVVLCICPSLFKIKLAH